jgi:hypothetical protein
MACDKNQTYLQGGESGIGRISGGWKFPNSPIYDQSESADYHLTTVFTQATPWRINVKIWLKFNVKFNVCY